MSHPSARLPERPRTFLSAPAILVVALAAAVEAATAPGPFGYAGGTCGLAAYQNPGPADQRSLVTVTTQTVDGLELEGSCGISDGFSFAPGLSQSFLGGSHAFAMGMVSPGLLRMYGEVGAEGSPVSYGPGFVIGENPYRARAQLGVTVGFADVVIPPAGSAAPNVGDPTTIDAVGADRRGAPEEAVEGDDELVERRVLVERVAARIVAPGAVTAPAGVAGAR